MAIGTYSAHKNGLAFGPAPRFVLPEEQAEDLVKSASHSFAKDARKYEAYQRFQVWQGDYEHLVKGFIAKVMASRVQQAEIFKHVTTINNIARDITRQTSVVWKQGALRSVKGAGVRKTDALNRVLNDALLDLHAPTWNQLAFIEGPVIVLPVMRRSADGDDSALGWDVLLPHFYEVIRDPLRPWGLPLAAAYTVRPTPRHRLGHSAQIPEADTILVDSESYRYYDTKGGGARLVETVPHGVGRFPGAVLRTELPLDGDWYGRSSNERLCKASIMLSFLEAKLGFVRKTQDRKLPVLSGNLDGVPGQMEQDPEIPLTLHAESPEIIRFEALDFDISPENALKHISHFAHTIARAYGGRARVVDNSGGLLIDVEFDYEEQAELRMAQVPFARAFERDLAEAVVGVLTTFDKTLESVLPTQEQIVEGYRIELPPLSRRFSNVQEMRDHIDWELSKGFTDHAEAFRKLNDPTMSEKDAIKRVGSHIDTQSTFVEKLTKRNMSLDPENNGDPNAAPQGNTTDLDEGPAERNGRLGGRATPGEGGEAEGEQAPVQEFDEAGEPIPMATVEAPDPNAADPGEAFNGAQVNALVELAKSVSLGELPYETAVQIAVVSYPINEARARKIMEPARTHKQPPQGDDRPNPNREEDSSQDS